MARKNNYIPLKDVPDVIVELTGVARSKAAVYAWIKRGRISNGGELIRLKTSKRMGRLYTTREWVEEFVRSV